MWQVAANLVGFLVAAWAGWILLRSRVTSQNTIELERLVAARGDRIDDLEKCIAELTKKVEELHGQMEMLQRLKAQEIAVELYRILEARNPGNPLLINGLTNDPPFRNP